MKTSSPRFGNLSARRHRNQARRNPRRLRRLLFEQFEDRRVLATAAGDSFWLVGNGPLSGNTSSNDSVNYSWTEPWYDYEIQEWVYESQYAQWYVVEPALKESFSFVEGNFEYTPGPGFIDTDLFTYEVYDNGGWSDSATVTITRNTPPEAASDTFFVAKNGSLYISTSTLLANDEDANGHSLTASLVTDPVHGTLTPNWGGGYTYVPPTGHVGSDSFEYHAYDGYEYSDTVTVTITTNTPPEAASDTFVVAKNSSLYISTSSLLANDEDANGHSLTAAVITNPVHGTLTPNGAGAYTYVPATGYVGWESFLYHAYDGYNYSEYAIVSIKVNERPTAADDSFTVLPDATNWISAPGVLANDADPNGDLLLASPMSAPVYGTLNLFPNGLFSYTPQPGYSGPDSFAYSASDGETSSTWATVSLTVLPIDATLVAFNRGYPSIAGQSVVVAAPGVFGDEPYSGPTRTALLATEPTFGTVTLNPDGSFNYVASIGNFVQDSFTYRFSTGQAVSPLATVTITNQLHPDLTITKFYSDGTDFQIQYAVAGDTIGPFTVGIYASLDGETPLGDPLQSKPAIHSQGLHTLTIEPTFTDLDSDYYLVARLDIENQISEFNENDNEEPFEPGSFLVNEADTGDTVLHIHGSDANDSPISVIKEINAGVPNWVVHTAQAALPAPPTGCYDFTGDGLVTITDANASIHYASGQPFNWQAPGNRFDVDLDGVVAANDALILINHYNYFGERVLYGYPTAPGMWLDVSGDKVASVLDILQIFDKLNGGTGNVSSPTHCAGQGSLILWFLQLGEIDYGNIPLDRVHIRAHDGDDSAGSHAPALIFGGAGVDTLYGSDLSDTLDGGPGDDYLHGQGGNDALFGGPGNDWLHGDWDMPANPWFHPGSDILHGGDGDDQLFGHAFDDQLFGDAGLDTLAGHAGNDSLTGGNDADTLTGGDGNDTLSGNAGNDNLFGGTGDDSVTGGDGVDNLVGEAGNDNLDGGTGNDSLTGSAGHDQLIGGAGNDSLSGNDGNDSLSGGGDNDSLAGGAGNDNLDGGDGADSATGGAGDDEMSGGSGNDTLNGDEGNDSLDGGDGEDSIEGGSGQDRLAGNDGSDTINGGDGHDYLDGGDGHDFLNGGNGTDTIYSANGGDQIFSSGGNDSVNGSGGTSSCSEPPGGWTIEDFCRPLVAFQGLTAGGGGYEGGSAIVVLRRIGWALYQYTPYQGELQVTVRIDDNWQDTPVEPATIGVDFDSPLEFVVTIPENEPSVEFSIPLFADSPLEPLEGFSVEIIDIEGLPFDGTGHISRFYNVSITDSTVEAFDDTLAPGLNPTLTFSPVANDKSGGTLNPLIYSESPLKLKVLYFGDPDHGTVTRNEDPRFADYSLVYTPDPNYTGDVSFTYTATNGYQSDEATVYFTTGPSVSVADATALVEDGEEGVPAVARFRVWLSESRPHSVSVDFDTVDLPAGDEEEPADRARARAGRDYTSKSMTLTFNPGQTEKWVEVPIEADDIDEYSEPFGVELSNPSNVHLGQAAATALITDDDDEPELSIAHTAVTEPADETTEAKLLVTLSRKTEKEATVNFVTAELAAPDPEEEDWLPATPDEDFTSTESTATLPTDALSIEITIDILADDDSEPDEKFSVTLVSAENATLAEEESDAEVTITELALDDSDFNLAIDSNNDGQITVADNEVEDIAGDDEHPGKVILVSNFDSDDDGLLDWADGFHWMDGVTADNTSTGTSFTPLILTIPADLDRATLELEFTYSASNPAQYATNYYAGKEFDRPTDGALRIWTKNSADSRHPARADNGGDFIAPGSYTAQELGISGTTATFYIEAINPSAATADQAITVRLTGGGIPEEDVVEDRVRVTAGMMQIIASSSVDGIDDFETYGFIATRLPQYDGLTGEPLFTDWKPVYTINVYDPRATIQQVNVEGQAIPLVRIGSNKYSTSGPVIAIRESEVPILVADQLVEFKSDVTDEQGNLLAEITHLSQRPSDIVGDAYVVAIGDGVEPVIQYNPPQDGTRLIFSGLSTGPKRLIATLVSQAEDELKNLGWIGNAADDGAFGKAVSDKVRARIAEFWPIIGQANRWKTGVLVNLQDRKILDFGVSQGTATAVELDVVYFENGYNPGKNEILDLDRCLVFEIKASGDGRVREPQLTKLRQMNVDNIVNVLWTKWRWDPGSNTLKPNFKFYRRLDEATTLGLAKVGVVVATGAVFVALNYSDQKFVDFEEQLFILRNYIRDNRQPGEIDVQKLVVFQTFKVLVDSLSGGTSDEYTSVAVLDFVYRKLLPRVLNSVHWQQP